MERYELFGVQQRFSEEPLLLLGRRDSGGYVGVRLSAAQFKALEATRCHCASASDQDLAVLALTQALGLRLLGIAILLRDLESAATWMVLDSDDQTHPPPVAIDPLDALTLVLRTGLPLLGVETPIPEEIARDWPYAVHAPAELEVPPMFHSVLESLNLDRFEHE